MTGRWSDAEESLGPEQNRSTPDPRLAAIAAASAEYVEGINADVTYFLEQMWERRRDDINAILGAIRDRKRAFPLGQTTLGTLKVDNHDGTCVEWCLPVPNAEWPHIEGTNYDHRFAVLTDGRWYFGFSTYAGDINIDPTEYVYGFDADRQFVPSVFPPVANGTVGTLVRKFLIAMLRYYNLPLPA